MRQLATSALTCEHHLGWGTFPRYAAFTALLGLLAGLCHAQTPAARPILFMNGICGDTSEWDPLYLHIRSFVLSDPQLGTQYAKDPNFMSPQKVYYDGSSVKTWPEGNDLLATYAGNSSLRFFEIVFFD